MAGDGVNDARAPAGASVGVPMGRGTDVARERADVVLIGNDLLRFTETLRIARWTRRIIWQNFAGTIAADSVGILLAAVGALSPTLAAFIHVASEMTFILNSARCYRHQEQMDRHAETGGLIITSVGGVLLEATMKPPDFTGAPVVDP